MYNKAHYEKNKPAHIEAQRRYRAKVRLNPEKHEKYKAHRRLKAKERYPLAQAARIRYRKTPEGRYNDYRRSAKQMKREFTLTLEEFKHFWQKPCYYCGEAIATVGLDRIDNTVGYLRDNIRSCCEVCNWMKRDYLAEEFLRRCEMITRRQNGGR